MGRTDIHFTGGSTRSGSAMQVQTIRALLAAERYSEALTAAHQALGDNPDSGEVWSLAAAAAGRLGAADLAAKFALEASRLLPKSPEIWNQLGAIHMLQGDHGAAAEAHRQAIRLSPHCGHFHAALGMACWLAGDLPAAVTAFTTALRLDPADHPTRNWLGAVQLALGDTEAARQNWQTVLKAAPDFLPARTNLGNLLMMQRDYPAAIAQFDHAIALDPGDADLLATRLYLKKRIADWSAHDDFRDLSDPNQTAGKPADPWSLLVFEDHPAHARARAERYATTFPVRRIPARPRAVPGRLKIGYFSSDILDHATMHLLGGVLEHHDRDRFETHLFALNPLADTPIVARTRASVTHLHAAHGMADADLIGAARHLDLQIAVDLKGFTQSARPALFTEGVAPLQVNYLGFPGTLGSAGWDYLVADPVVIPPAERRHYTERVIFMPHSYQPNDDARPRPEDTSNRADHGLPATGRVLCCFNDPYKISPREFDIWMTLLRAAPDAVLWLLASNRWVEPNLRDQAARRGVDAARLIFAPKLLQDRHLARQCHADLFLDSFCYNAHTTASDALWMGLPVLTLAGRQFSARVSASLLHAVGLDEMIATSEDAYLATARNLLDHPDRLTQVRTRLKALRDGAALFDTARYTASLEQGYAAIWQRHAAGLPPEDIRLRG